MAKKHYCISLIYCLAILLCLDSFGQVGLASGKPVKKPPKVVPVVVAPAQVTITAEAAKQKQDSIKQVEKQKLRERILILAKQEVGVVERTGRNDHPRIEAYHRSVSEWLANYRPAQPYCASFVNYIMKAAGVKVTGVANPARARDWFAVKSRIVLTQQTMRGNQRMMKLPEKGAVVGYIFYGNAISHVEILDRIDLNEGYIYCVGANTSSRGSAVIVDREGNGVYYVKRKIKMFYAIADVI